METFYHCLIGKPFNVETVKTQISQEPIITFQNNILAPQTKWKGKNKWCKVCGFSFHSNNSWILIKLQTAVIGTPALHWCVIDKGVMHML